MWNSRVLSPSPTELRKLDLDPAVLDGRGNDPTGAKRPSQVCRKVKWGLIIAAFEQACQARLGWLSRRIPCCWGHGYSRMKGKPSGCRVSGVRRRAPVEKRSQRGQRSEITPV